MRTRIILFLILTLLAPWTAWAASSSKTTLASGTRSVEVITIAAAYTAAQTDTAIVSVSAGSRIVVTGSTFTCDMANTVNVSVYIGFGATTTPTTTGVLSTHPGVAPGSGLREMDTPLGLGADGEDVRITMTVPTTGSCNVKITYYTIASGS
jgi:hypothetical protein